MEYSYCIIGESCMKDFTPWWEFHLPSYLIVYCLKGEVELRLEFKTYRFQEGMVSIVPPDMYPSFSSMTETFNTFYCLISRDLAEKVFYDIPTGIYDAFYTYPILSMSDTMGDWMRILTDIYTDNTNLFRQNILASLLHAFAQDYFDKWTRQYGNQPVKDNRNPAEKLCTKFYSLLFDHFKEYRATTYYADRLCITPNYLAMITRQISGETPKQAISRQVILEMKYILRNTNMTAEQMACHLNFPDTSYMCRFFRRQTGMSFSEYRKSIVTL